jgi:tetratricopeptide (TPR) repeat protein
LTERVSALLQSVNIRTEARNNLGNALLAQYEKVAAIRSDHAAARDNLDEALAALRFNIGESLGKGRGSVAPNDAKLFVTLANIYWRRYEWELAASAFRMAETLDPNSVEATFGLAMMLPRIGRDTEAAALLKRLIERGAPRVKALVRLAALPVSADGIDLVSELEQAIQSVPPDERRVGVAFALACALEKVARHAEAWRYLVGANRARFTERRAWRVDHPTAHQSGITARAPR